MSHAKTGVSYIWGATHENLPDHIPSTSRPTDLESLVAHLGTCTIWDVLGFSDLFLPPFRAASDNTSIPYQSKASQLIPEAESLKVVLEDLEWVEDIERIAQKKWHLLPPSPPANSHLHWAQVSADLLSAARLLPRQLYRRGVDSVCDENTETDTDKRAIQEPSLMSSLYELVASPPFPEDSFMAYTQNAEQIPGGGPVKPDVGMEFIRCRDDRRNLLRIEAKTILVQLKHAPDLQDLIGLYRNDAAWEKKKTAEGIFTQAYAASLTKRNGPNSLPPSNIVVLGNPGLYRVGYTLNGQLVLSKFYSTNPQQALTLLIGQSNITFTVHQGYLLRQKMALTVVEDRQWFENRAAQRSKLSLSLSSIIAGFVKSTVDSFTRLSEILLRRPRGDLVLNGPCVHVCASRGHPDFLAALPTMKTFRTIKSGHVWGNGSWYLKIPHGLDEIKALEELSGEARIPEFGALLRVTTGEHAGKLLVATRAVGEQAGSANDRLNLDVDMQRDILACLKSIHAAGWHHHDVHPGNVVVSEDGKVTLVDLGRAQLASKCMASQISCADEETIAELSAVESSLSESKETRRSSHKRQ